jgi:hypothetical protein
MVSRRALELMATLDFLHDVRHCGEDTNMSERILSRFELHVIDLMQSGITRHLNPGRGKGGPFDPAKMHAAHAAGVDGWHSDVETYAFDHIFNMFAHADKRLWPVMLDGGESAVQNITRNLPTPMRPHFYRGATHALESLRVIIPTIDQDDRLSRWTQLCQKVGELNLEVVP